MDIHINRNFKMDSVIMRAGLKFLFVGSVCLLCCFVFLRTHPANKNGIAIRRYARDLKEVNGKDLANGDKSKILPPKEDVLNPPQGNATNTTPQQQSLLDKNKVKAGDGKNLKPQSGNPSTNGSHDASNATQTKSGKMGNVSTTTVSQVAGNTTQKSKPVTVTVKPGVGVTSTNSTSVNKLPKIVVLTTTVSSATTKFNLSSSTTKSSRSTVVTTSGSAVVTTTGSNIVKNSTKPGKGVKINGSETTAKMTTISSTVTPTKAMTSRPSTAVPTTSVTKTTLPVTKSKKLPGWVQNCGNQTQIFRERFAQCAAVTASAQSGTNNISADFLNVVFSDATLTALSSCEPGTWCLGLDKVPAYQSIVQYCHLANCLESKKQSKDCPELVLAADTLKLLCALSPVSADCARGALAQLYVTLSDVIRSRDLFSQAGICSTVEEKSKCSRSCKTLAKDFLCMQSVCKSSTLQLFNSVSDWSWFFGSRKESMVRCGLSLDSCTTGSHKPADLQYISRRNDSSGTLHALKLATFVGFLGLFFVLSVFSVNFICKTYRRNRQRTQLESIQARERLGYNIIITDDD